MAEDVRAEDVLILPPEGVSAAALDDAVNSNKNLAVRRSASEQLADAFNAKLGGKAVFYVLQVGNVIRMFARTENTFEPPNDN